MSDVRTAPLPGPQGRGVEATGALAGVCQGLDEAVLLIDREHVVRYANPAAVALLGLAEDAVGSRIERAVSDYRLSLMVAACLDGRGEVTRELVDPVEGRHVIARAISFATPAGEREAALVLRDESRIRRLERVRRDFVANVSHELRTPVAAIQLLVETLQEGALEDPAVAAEFVGKIGLEVGHMAQIVSELLELSAIEAGRRPLRAEPVPVEALVEAAARLRPLADERRIELRFTVDPAVPPVRGDAAALAQVVRNLVHNAIKFTPAGGRITVTARRACPDATRVELRVADTGPGIAPEATSRIFERFYKADKSRQRDGEGTGLGLAIARHTVEAHRGSIGVESELGAGSTFIVVLPAAGMTTGS